MTNSRKLAEEIADEVERLLKILPTANTAGVSWRDYGEVILCATYEEMLQVANDIASEHVQVMTDRDDWFLENMHSYGALFLGPRTHVANGGQGHRHQPYAADEEGRAVYRPAGRQVPENPQLARADR